MRKEYHRLDFDLQEMITLRMQGWSTPALGKKYCKDHTTILYHCRKMGIKAVVVIRAKSVERDSDDLPIPSAESIPKIPVHDKYAYAYEDDVNVGKTYAQYLMDERKRKRKAARTGGVRVTAFAGKLLPA